MFDNEDEALFPNQFVNVRLLVDTVKDATVVPVAAIQRGQPGTFVYLVKADDTGRDPRRRDSASPTASSVAVTKGLEVGDQVVIDGADRLRDGAKIRRPVGRPRAAGTPVRRSRPRRRDGSPPRPTAPRRGQRRGDGERQARTASAGRGERAPAPVDPRRPTSKSGPRHEPVAALHPAAGRRPRC